MTFEQIKSEILSYLGDHSSSVQVFEETFDWDRIRPSFLQGFYDKKLNAVQFFLNGNSRYVMFYTTENGRTLFSKPKAGITDQLVYSLQPVDIRFKLDGNRSDNFYVLRKFVASLIAERAEREITRLPELWLAGLWGDIPPTHSTGFKIIQIKPESLGYVASVVFHVIRDGKLHVAYGQVEDGICTSIWDPVTKEQLNRRKFFE